MRDLVAQGLSFLARRWGTSPMRLRQELTYEQFAGFVSLERSAFGDEMKVQAYGTYAAVAQILGGKKTKALEHFARSVEVKRAPPKGAKIGGGHADVAILKERIRAAMASGEM